VATAVQAKVVPGTVEERFTSVLTAPEHNVWVRGQLVTVGLGFTVTVWVATEPGHPPNEESNVKVTVCGRSVTLKKVMDGIGEPVPGATGHGLILPTGQAADHEKSVPATVELMVTAEVGAPEQTG
jgi:hypothetical protein